MAERFSRVRAGWRGLVAAGSVLSWRRCGLTMAAVVGPVLLAGCGETPGDLSERAYRPLSPQLIALMQQKGTTPQAPVLLRAFKKEAEVQVWKMKADGHYTLFKSYPICRWSGQLGPKTREGDRQVPEGFYSIAPAQMNPHSNYYLSFNVGYPNAYDRAHGYTGGNIMVHGVCSSAGCFSMTDQQIAEIYAIAREAFAGGQQAIQMQSYPFHMTPENFARYRLDPNMPFWKELEVGNEAFEVTKKDVEVAVCNDHYVFDAEPVAGGTLDPAGPCPALKRDPDLELALEAKEKSDAAKVAELVAGGVAPIHTVYSDGGQNPLFSKRRIADVSRPEALAAGPVDVPMRDRKRSKTQLEAMMRRAEKAATLAEQEAAAAHAVAYVDLTPPPTAQPAAPKAQAAPQGFQLPGLGHLFASQTTAPTPQPQQTAAVPPQPALVPPRLANAPPPGTVAASPGSSSSAVRGAEQDKLATLEHPKGKGRALSAARGKFAHTRVWPGIPPLRGTQAKLDAHKADRTKTAKTRSDEIAPATDGAPPLPPTFSAAAADH